MSTVARLFAQLQENDIVRLRAALYDISVHIGGDPGRPETVVKAAESARDALNRYKGHSGIPLDTYGHPVPFSVVGR